MSFRDGIPERPAGSFCGGGDASDSERKVSQLCYILRQMFRIACLISSRTIICEFRFRADLTAYLFFFVFSCKPPQDFNTQIGTVICLGKSVEE